jgi:hypothetical protein
MLCVGDTLKVIPLQINVLIALIVAFGLTPTLNVKDAPVHTPVNGVITYVAVCNVFNGLLNVPLMTALLVALAPPVIPPVAPGTDQLYKVPAGTMPSIRFVGVTVNVTPLHTIVLIALITAVGFNVTVTVKLDPVHTPVNGVITYVAVCCVFNGLLNVPLMIALLVALAPPVIPPVVPGTDQL